MEVAGSKVYELFNMRRELLRDNEILLEKSLNAEVVDDISGSIGKALVGKIVEAIDPSAMPYGRPDEKSMRDPILPFYPRNCLSSLEPSHRIQRSHSRSNRVFVPSSDTARHSRISKITGEVVGDDPENNSIVIKQYSHLWKLGKVGRILSVSGERVWVRLIDNQGRKLVHIEEISN